MSELSRKINTSFRDGANGGVVFLAERDLKKFALEITDDVDENGLITDSQGLAINAGLFSQPVEFQTYTVKSGDTISGITKKFGLTNISTLISVNDIGNVRQLGAGQ